jgi:hypothetical protein
MYVLKRWWHGQLRVRLNKAGVSFRWARRAVSDSFESGVRRVSVANRALRRRQHISSDSSSWCSVGSWVQFEIQISRSRGLFCSARKHGFYKRNMSRPGVLESRDRCQLVTLAVLINSQQNVQLGLGI